MTTQISKERYIQLTNLHRILPNGELSSLTSLYINTSTGLISIPPSLSSFDSDIKVIDLNGKWVSPGMIDIQINGAFGVDLSEFDIDNPNPEEEEKRYIEDCKKMSWELCKIGVTGFLPTIISQNSETYKKVLPLLTQLPNLLSRQQGYSMPLGWHLEGPFLHPLKKGCHPPLNLVSAPNGIQSLYDVYGKENLSKIVDGFIKMITLAPDVEGILNVIEELKEGGWRVSLGHTNASTEQALEGISRGAQFLTHLFNAMPSLHHRNPGMIGLLGLPEQSTPKSLDRPSMSQKVVSTAPTPMTRSKAPTRVPSPVLELHEAEDELTQENLIEQIQQNDAKKPDLNRQLTHQLDNLSIQAHAGSLENLTEIESNSESFLNNGSDTSGESEVKNDLISYLVDGNDEKTIKRPYFSIIADDIHVHPQAVGMAYNSHPEGCILISDAMHMLDPTLPDGLHQWRESLIEKKNGGITLAGTDTLAGSILPLSEAVINLSKFTCISVHKAVVCATYTPAKALGGDIEKKFGLRVGCWADLNVWDEEGLKGVWKGGREVWYKA